jgi:zinc transporter ZupT
LSKWQLLSTWLKLNWLCHCNGCICRPLLPLSTGFAAGCMMWVVLAELLPDALEAVGSDRVATCATASAAW